MLQWKKYLEKRHVLVEFINLLHMYQNKSFICQKGATIGESRNTNFILFFAHAHETTFDKVFFLKWIAFEKKNVVTFNFCKWLLSQICCWNKKHQVVIAQQLEFYYQQLYEANTIGCLLCCVMFCVLWETNFLLASEARSKDTWGEVSLLNIVWARIMYTSM